MIYKNKAFRITMNVIMVLLTLCCILPFILLIASSFSSEADLTKYGYSFIPRGFTLAAINISGQSKKIFFVLMA